MNSHLFQWWQRESGTKRPDNYSYNAAAEYRSSIVEYNSNITLSTRPITNKIIIYSSLHVRGLFVKTRNIYVFAVLTSLP